MLICIAVVYILYCVLRTLKPLCFPTPAVSRSNRVHSVSHARIARLFSNDSTRPNSAPTLPNSRAMSQQTNIPPYGGTNQNNYSKVFKIENTTLLRKILYKRFTFFNFKWLTTCFNKTIRHLMKLSSNFCLFYLL